MDSVMVRYQVSNYNVTGARVATVYHKVQYMAVLMCWLLNMLCQTVTIQPVRETAYMLCILSGASK